MAMCWSKTRLCCKCAPNSAFARRIWDQALGVLCLISENQRLTLNGWAFDSLASKANIVMDAIMSAIGPKQTCRKTQSVPLLGVKRTCHFALHTSAFDPKRTSAG